MIREFPKFDNYSKSKTGFEIYSRNLHSYYNEMYFGAKLSPIDIIIGPMLNKAFGIYNANRNIIYLAIDIFKNESVAETTILHEMCHQAVHEIDKDPNEHSHGKHFKEWMLKSGLNPHTTRVTLEEMSVISEYPKKEISSLSFLKIAKLQIGQNIFFIHNISKLITKGRIAWIDPKLKYFFVIDEIEKIHFIKAAKNSFLENTNIDIVQKPSDMTISILNRAINLFDQNSINFRIFAIHPEKLIFFNQMISILLNHPDLLENLENHKKLYVLDYKEIYLIKHSYLEIQYIEKEKMNKAILFASNDNTFSNALYFNNKFILRHNSINVTYKPQNK